MADERPNVNAMAAALDRAVGSAERCRSEWQAFQDTVEALRAAQGVVHDLKEYDAIRTGISKEVHALKEQKVALEREIEAHQAGLQDLKAGIVQKRAAFEEATAATRKAREAFEAERAELHAKLDALRAEWSALLEKLKPPSLRQTEKAAK